MLSGNVNNVEQGLDGVTQSGNGIWQIEEDSGSAMNPGSYLKDDMVEFASIDAVLNDSLQIVSARSTITAEEM